jgi:pimeloyl-ACP methyl ester carboxylesterase
LAIVVDDHRRSRCGARGDRATPPLAGDVSIATLADAVTAWFADEGLEQPDIVGSSMGARLALELARRGVAGATVALDPGGFWRDAERIFEASIAISIRLVRLAQPVMPAIVGNPITRTALFAQFSAHPWTIPAPVALTEMRTFAAAPSFDPLLHALVHGPEQQGLPAGAARAPITIGWGRQDRVCFPSQAARALAAFPDARLHWFENCGHFPQWDAPAEAVRVILATTDRLRTDSVRAFRVSGRSQAR